MAKTLDFNKITPPILPLIMPDDDRTEIKVTTPKQALVEELIEAAPELDAVLKNGDADTIRAIYDLAARLISCNLNGITVTADELRDKYKFNYEYLVIFYNAYVDFINELTNQKN